MAKYKVPLVGDGTISNPYRPKYDVPKGAKVFISIPGKYAIVETSTKSSSLEKYEDVEKLE